MNDKETNKKWKVKIMVYPEVVDTCTSPFVKEELDMICTDAEVTGRLSHIKHIVKGVIESFKKGETENGSNERM